MQQQDDAAGLSHAEWLGFLIDREADSRSTRRYQSRMRAAKLRHVGASIEDVDYRTPRQLDRDLFRQLADDTNHLVRQEINLAKLEMKQTGEALARDGMKIGIAVALGLVGALALGAFLIIALGALLGNYWLSALLVGVLFLVVSGLLARAAVSHFKEQSLKPEETIETLREDTAWAKREARDFKRELTA